MIVGRIAKYARILLVLLVIVVVCSLALGMGMQPVTKSGVPDTPAVEADSSPSVTCTPFGLCGDITTPLLVDRLSSSGDNLTLVGTTNGLYVVAPGGKLQHFLYSPFGIKHMALINDITGDGIREVVVALDDTQVPALRCYDGVTWEKLWQFAPMARIWDKLWVERQLIITNLAVIEDGDSQRVVITSGRCVLSVDAKEGLEQWQFTASAAVWRMVTLADLNGDGAHEVLVGSDDGRLFWLNGKTGKAQWQTKLPEHKGVDYGDFEHPLSDIVVINREEGKVVVASADGWAQMYDLGNKRREWYTPVFQTDNPEDDGMDRMVDFSSSQSGDLLLSPTADMTGDGLPEVMVTKATSSSQYEYSVYTNDGKAALCDSTGNILWEKDTIACSNLGVETGSFEGKPVFLQRGTAEVTLVDLKDGQSVLHTVPLGAAIDPGLVIWQPGGDGYLTFSSTGDLAAISAKGELLWYCPRITNVKAEGGNFVGDATEDVLLWGESGTQQSSNSVPVYDAGGKSIQITAPTNTPQGQEPEARLLHMMDGATRAKTWSFEMPYGEFKNSGGLKGIKVAPDLVGADGIQDIIGYREDTVFIFSGNNGTLSTFPVGQPIASLDVIRNGASGNAIAVGIAGGLSIFDGGGTPLWTTTSAAWVGDGTGGFMMLDDINSDNVSDLAVTSAAKIVVLESVATTDNYELHLTLKAEAGYSIQHTEIVPDENQDGMEDLAYIQNAQANQQGGQTPCPLLSQTSLVDGKEMLKVNMPSGVMAYDLACGDFNGDGYADSLFSCYEGNICGSTPSSQGEHAAGMVYLWVLSGKDGTTLWMRPFDQEDLYWGSTWGSTRSEVPVTNVGDADGDGADDLASRFAPRGKSTYSSSGISSSHSFTSSQHQQSGLEIYSIAQDSVVRSIPTSLLIGSGYFSQVNTGMLRADVDADGHAEVIDKAFEPRIYSSDDLQCFAVVDLDTGRRLAGFTGFDISDMSLFESHQPGILGVAGCGGVCFLHMSSDLQITSPDDGARTGPTVGVKWDGPTDGDFSQVFVDGVRNDITNGFESQLYLGRGDHGIVVRSVDDYGRISYSPSDLSAPLAIKVTPSPWKPVWLVLSLFVLLAMVLLLFYARLQRTWRARKRAAK